MSKIRNAFRLMAFSIYLDRDGYWVPSALYLNHAAEVFIEEFNNQQQFEYTMKLKAFGSYVDFDNWLLNTWKREDLRPNSWLWLAYPAAKKRATTRLRRQRDGSKVEMR